MVNLFIFIITNLLSNTPIKQNPSKSIFSKVKQNQFKDPTVSPWLDNKKDIENS